MMVKTIETLNIKLTKGVCMSPIYSYSCPPVECFLGGNPGKEWYA